MPRVLIAAPTSGSGKTMITTGLLAALRHRGLAVSPHKVGPDYIDPGYHTAAAGRPGRNLDAHLVGEDLLVPLLLHGALTPEAADIGVIEGVMGLFDGALGTQGFASSAHIAQVTRTPVVLTVNCASASRSLGALVHGFATFDPQVRIGGVILNNLGSPRHEAEVRSAVEAVGVPVLGAIPRLPDVVVPSRHLGLIPAAERRPEAEAAIAALQHMVDEYLDLDALLALAATAPDLIATPWNPAAAIAAATGGTHGLADESGRPVPGPNPGPGAGPGTDPTVSPEAGPGADPAVSPGAGPETRPVVAIAAGAAFTFGYAETPELLAAAGARVVTFDPLHDEDLPPGTAGLVIGGGFPEVHAAELAANRPLREAVARFAADGGPIVAECAGLLFLTRELDGSPMCGVLPATARMDRRLVLGYRHAMALTESVYGPVGTRVTGHEFHRTRVNLNETLTPDQSPVSPAWAWRDGAGQACEEGFVYGSVHASYLHTHWAARPQVAAALVAAAGGRGSTAGSFIPPGRREAPRPAPPGGRSAGTSQTPGPTGSPAAASSEASTTDENSVPSAAAATDRGRFTTASAEQQQLRAAAGPELPDPQPSDPLRHHGDAEVEPGMLDLAVNVVVDEPPEWLQAELHAALQAAASYPDEAHATARLADHLRIPRDRLLLVNGAAQAFSLLAQARPWWAPVVVHPQFTEPEAALIAAGCRPRRLLLEAADGFRLDSARLDPARLDPARLDSASGLGADLVIVGNPTNPTSRLHSPADLLALRVGGTQCVLVVDEAFMDLVPGEHASLLPACVGAAEPTGLLVLRSLTKSFGLAGIRAGYVVGDPALIARLRELRPPWSVNTMALAAVAACASAPGAAHLLRLAAQLPAQRDHLQRVLTEAGLSVVPEPAGPFVLARHQRAAELRRALRRRGVAVRRGDTFPGLDASWLRLAVRAESVTDRFAVLLAEALGDLDGHPMPDENP